MDTPNPLVTQLGYPADARLVIFHADDVGMCHGSNQAYLDLCAFGLLQTGSVMMPCPWAQELLQACQQNPALDMGVHLTLTSEWSGYRWGPISTRDPASGLIDAEGYFWHRVQPVQDHLRLDAAFRFTARLVAVGSELIHVHRHAAMQQCGGVIG